MLKDRALHKDPCVRLIPACFLRDQVAQEEADASPDMFGKSKENTDITVKLGTP